MNAKEIIANGQAIFGMELGSTRIKAVLTDDSGTVLAIGSYDWENSLIDGIWTYSLEQIHDGVKGCYASLREEVEKTYGVTPKSFKAMGVSAMMHGYMPFDADGKLLSRFQTWRNTNTQDAADALTELFDFNIPLRWTIAHVYQCMLDNEEHVQHYAFVTLLSSYLHYLLTGEKVVGIDDASGMFPIDSDKLDFDETMVQKFDALAASKGYTWKLREIFPKVLVAGEQAGVLTAEGAALLDDSGNLQPGIPFCPPEGDAGTGMVATNSVDKRTGNVSAGTSFFAMIVLEKRLSKVYREIDMVTTPDGSPVAMAHSNNGTTDLNTWVGLFHEFAGLLGAGGNMGDTFEKLYRHSLTGDADCGGMVAFNYDAGESMTGVNEGRPLFVRMPDSKTSLANFMKTHLYAALGVVKLGMDILKAENVRIDSILGHGGFFKTPEVGQRALAAAVGAPVTVMDTASEGGAWGIALLAAYTAEKLNGSKETLGEFLNNRIFAGMNGTTLAPTEEEIAGFEVFMEHYRAALAAEKAAVAHMKW